MLSGVLIGIQSFEDRVVMLVDVVVEVLFHPCLVKRMPFAAASYDAEGIFVHRSLAVIAFPVDADLRFSVRV